MKAESEGLLVRIFVGASDTWHGKPLYEAIVLPLLDEMIPEGLITLEEVRVIAYSGAGPESG